MAGNEKLYRRVCDAILQRLRNGEFAPGDRLPGEREMAEAFSVSRTTVREAIVALEMLGMVEMRQGSGIYVVGPPNATRTSEELDVGAFELMEARRIYETETASLAATRIDSDGCAELERLLVEMRGDDISETEKADREFHLAIARATGNGAMVAIVTNLWDMRERPLARTILERSRGPGSEMRADEHAAILQALKAGDPAAAGAAMRLHIDRVIDHLLTMTENEEIQAARSRTQELRQRLLGPNR